MAKEEYIPIESLEELKKKLNMSLMNKKFKDIEGNKYVVRFVKESRKLEIFKLHTKSEIESNVPAKPKVVEKAKEVEQPKVEFKIEPKFTEEEPAQPITLPKIKKILTEPKIKALNTSPKIHAISEELSLDDFDLNIENSPSEKKPKYENKLKPPISLADEKLFLSDLMKFVQKDKERISSTITNLKNSRVFEITGDPSENKNIISNISRDFESEIFTILDGLQAKFKEIVTFPKSINHYSMNYSRIQKDILASQNSDETRFEYILRWEMLDPALQLCNKFSKMSTEVLNILNQKTEDDIKKLNSSQETLFKDAKSALLFCLDDMNYIRKILETWKINVQNT